MDNAEYERLKQLSPINLDVKPGYDRWEAYQYKGKMWRIRQEGSKDTECWYRDYTQEMACKLVEDHNWVQDLISGKIEW